MAVAFRSVASASGSGTAPSVAVPSGAAQYDIAWVDLYLDANATDSDATIIASAPAGFSSVVVLGNSTQGTRGRHFVFWKRLTGADAGTYDFAQTVSVGWEISARLYSGVTRAGNPWNVPVQSVTNTSSTTATASVPSVTPGGTDSCIVGGASSHGTGSNPWTPPSGYTERYDGSAHLEAFDLVSPAASATGAITVTSTSTTGSTYVKGYQIPLAGTGHVRTRSTGLHSFSAITPQTVTLPAHEAGDRITVVCIGKTDAATIPTINQGFTLIGSFTGGTGTPGADAGPMFIAVYQKDAASSSETNPTLTAGATTPASWSALSVVNSPATGKTWRDAIATSSAHVQFISDTDTALPLTGTASAFASQPTTDDALLLFGGIPTDAAGAVSAGSMTVTGLSEGTVPVTTAFVDTNLGTDVGLGMIDWLNFTGTASAGVVASLTFQAVTNQSGVMAVLSLRQGVAGSNLSIAGSVPQPTMAVALTGMNDSDLSVAGSIPKPTLAVALSGFNDSDLSAAGTIPQPVMAVNLTATPTTVQLTVAGTIPQPTMALSLAGFNDSDLTFAGSIPQLTLAVSLETLPALHFDGTLPQPVLAVDLDVTATTDTIAVAATIPLPVLAVDLLAQVVFGTDHHNRAGGRVRNGFGLVSFDPALEPLPAALIRGVSYPIAQAFGPVTMVGSQPHFDVTTAYGVQTRRQILFGNKDITYLFGIPTPPISFQRAQPFDFGPGTLTLPQFANPQETVGAGRWSWLRVKRNVRERVIRVSDGVVLKTIYRGLVTGFDTDGPNLTVQLGGQATGRMGLRDQQAPLFSSKQNPKRLIARVFESIGIPFDDSGDEPNFEMGRFGGTGLLDYAQQVVARCWNTSGTQWSVMPNADGVYEMNRRDTTTIHGTIYLDDARTPGSLHRDISEEPNRIFGGGTTPEGRRIHNGVYPGLIRIDPIPPYPYNDGRTFGLGTTGAETDHGFSAMRARLQTLGYLSRDDAEDSEDVYTQDIADAVEEVQDEAGILGLGGNMTEATWDALFNVNVTGYSVWWSKIEPMASLRATRRWKRTPDGAILDHNPTYDASLPLVDRTLDFGAGFEVRQMHNFAKAELAAANDPNWVGTITLGLGAICRGDHTWGDPVDPMADWELDPGQNYKVVSSAGGELVVHCSGITYGDSPTQLTVDTRARDALPVWEVIRRNKESRGDLNRRANDQRRSSTENKDVIQEMEEYGGRIDPVPAWGGVWTGFPVVMGKAGQVNETRIRTRGATGDAESDVAAPTRFVLCVSAKDARSFLAANVPDPQNDKSPWYDEDFRERLRKEFGMWYIIGEPGALGGYYPKVQKQDGATITGVWHDDSPWSFRTGVQPIGYVSFFGEADTIIAGGRILENQEIVGS